jgi:hypothetical protein
MGREHPRKRRSPGNHSRNAGAGKGLVASVARVQFRVTPAQRAELEAEAEKRGLTVGEVARQRCFPEPGRKRSPRARAPVTSGFVRGVLAVVFRVTQEQRDVLELEALRWGTTVGEVARRRCFAARAKAAA